MLLITASIKSSTFRYKILSCSQKLKLRRIKNLKILFGYKNEKNWWASIFKLFFKIFLKFIRSKKFLKLFILEHLSTFLAFLLIFFSICVTIFAEDEIPSFDMLNDDFEPLATGDPSWPRQCAAPNCAIVNRALRYPHTTAR